MLVSHRVDSRSTSCGGTHNQRFHRPIRRKGTFPHEQEQPPTKTVESSLSNTGTRPHCTIVYRDVSQYDASLARGARCSEARPRQGAPQGVKNVVLRRVDGHVTLISISVVTGCEKYILLEIRPTRFGTTTVATAVVTPMHIYVGFEVEWLYRAHM